MKAVAVSKADAKLLPANAPKISALKLPNPYKKCPCKDLAQIEVWLRAQPKAAALLDALVERGVRLLTSGKVENVYVVCRFGKHRSVLVAALINERV